CRSIDVPPYTVAICKPRADAIGSRAELTWVANSRVGNTINPRGALGRLIAPASAVTTGIPKASVLPEPVRARPRTFSPDKASGMTADCTVVGSVMPWAKSTLTIESEIAKSENVRARTALRLEDKKLSDSKQARTYRAAQECAPSSGKRKAPGGRLTSAYAIKPRRRRSRGGPTTIESTDIKQIALSMAGTDCNGHGFADAIHPQISSNHFSGGVGFGGSSQPPLDPVAKPAKPAVRAATAARSALPPPFGPLAQASRSLRSLGLGGAAQRPHQRRRPPLSVP